MDDERRQMMRVQQEERAIEQGLKLRLIDTIPAGSGEGFSNELKTALESGDKDLVLSVLKKIGDMIHARWGQSTPTKPIYVPDEQKYQLGLATSTGGTRIMINTAPGSKHSGDLIFPNVNLSFKFKDRTLANVFEELFGSRAENIGSEDNPYYVVKILPIENLPENKEMLE